MRSKLMAHGDERFSMFLREIFIKALRYGADALDRPLIGMTNTANDYSSCHQIVPRLSEAVQRGVMQAGGLPIVFPTCGAERLSRHAPRLRKFRSRKNSPAMACATWCGSATPA
jgi:dihydroxy-acid dehydratase